MQEDEANPTEQQASRELPSLPAMVAYERPRRDIGFHFVDQVAREAKSVAGIGAITAHSYTVRSTINPQLQRAVETTLQEGLSHYERSAGRVQFVAPEAKLAKAVQRAEAERKPGDKRPAWQLALVTARLPLYDVHWTSAIVLEKPERQEGRGLAGGTGGRPRPASRGRQRRRAAQAWALRRGAGALDRRQGQGGCTRRASGAAGGAGSRGCPGEQDRPHPRDERRILRIRSASSIARARPCVSRALRSSR